MLDQVHTNQERITKVRSVFIAIEELTKTLTKVRGENDILVQTLVGLVDAAKEADGSLEAIEKFLDDRNALHLVD